MSDNYEHLLWNHSFEGLVWLDGEGRILSINPVFTQLFNYDAKEMEGVKFEELILETYLQSFQHYFRKQVSQPALVEELELYGRKKGKGTFSFLFRMITGTEGKWLGRIQSTEALRNAEVLHQTSSNKLNAIIEHAVDGIITITDRGIIEMVNPAAARLFGYEPEEMKGQNISMLMPEPHHSRHDSYIQNYKETGLKKIIGIGREVKGKRKDGSLFPFDLSISEIKLSDRRIFTGIIHDITHQKKAEEQLRQYASQLEQSNRELEDFAYVSSHDLQEPLRKIRAFGDRLLTLESKNVTEKGVDYLGRMLNAAERMQELIHDLLEYSRISTRANPFSSVDLKKVLEGVLSDLEVNIESKGAVIVVEDLVSIEADATQMRQIFQNLISNALKFSKKEEAPRIKIGYQPLQDQVSQAQEDQIMIWVEDNGIGFEQKYAEKIFNVFQRLEGKRYEGSGIGLSICQKIVNRHGGTIRAESEVGKGTKFTLILPLKQERSDDATN